MPVTNVIFYQDEQWYMQTLANVQPPFPRFSFAGATEEQQAQAVQQLGQLMKDNDIQGMMDNFSTFFPDQIQEYPAQEIMNISFTWPDSMLLPGQTVPISAESFGGETVEEVLPEFADILLGFFAAAIRRDQSKRDNVRMANMLERSIPGARNSILAPADGASYSIIFENYTEDTFPLIYWGADLQEGFGYLVTQPSGDLTSGGTQSLSFTQILNSVDVGPMDGYILFSTPDGQNYIGITLQVPFQLFEIGPAPYYQPAQNGTWGPDLTSQPFKYPSSFGYSISVTPTAGHTTLSVLVIVNTPSEAVAQRAKLPPPKPRESLFPEREKKIKREWAQRKARK